jgi:acyl-CoA dehydrogenase
MTLAPTTDERLLRDSVGAICARFGGDYWRHVDGANEYPDEFVDALTDAGWLAMLVPEEHGGAGLGISEAAIVLEVVNRSGGNSAACHAQMYILAALVRHGTDEQRRRYLPEIAAGRLRLQAFGVTEPSAGSETTRIQTFARRIGDRYVVNGQKIWTSRAAHSDLMLLLARTTPYEQLTDKTRGLSLFIVDLRSAVAAGRVTIRPIDTMLNHSTTEVFINDLEVPADDLVGEEGLGFRYILDGWNAERILIAAECVGDGHWFVERAAAYARERVVFGRPIGQNQGVQFPIARAYAAVVAADLVRRRAAELYDADERCGAEANMAKYLAAEASWEAANVCLDVHGGFGFAREYDVERKFRETRLYRVAPISQNLVLAYLAQHVLDMPRSY